ncbi:NUDIX hydrolase [Vibrio vulnificus]|nr:NUDIX hydrolase [Vibrio vulnificus]
MKKLINTIFKNGFMSVKKVENDEFGEGAFITFGRNKTSHGSIIVPVMKDGRVALTKEYRIGSDDWVIGVPKGAADQKTESFESIAKRELEEEVGIHFESLTITELNIYPLPAFAEFHGRVVFAKGCSVSVKPDLENGEAIEVFDLVTREELLELLRTGVINDAESSAALHHYLAFG